MSLTSRRVKYISRHEFKGFRSHTTARITAIVDERWNCMIGDWSNRERDAALRRKILVHTKTT